MDKVVAARSKQMSTPSVTGGSGTSRTAKSKRNFEEPATQRNQFLTMALNMSWQLAVVVLAPVVGGVFVDKALQTSPLFLLIGLALALLGTILVLWRTMQAANRLPVPKLTELQRQKIRKQYQEEDEDR